MVTEATEHRRLAAIMFTDMVGYSALAQRHEKLALELLGEQQRLLRPVFAQHNAREIKSTGDGFLLELASALQAVECAIAIQKTLAEHNASTPPERRVQLRIGLHVGDIVERDGDVFGDGVNIAARIEPLAEPGGICISRSVFDQVHNKLDLAMEPLGRPKLKHIEAPIGVYRVALPWARAPRAGRVAAASRRYSAMAVLTALAAVAVGGGLLWWAGRARESSVAKAPVAVPADVTKSIAVLPFVNMSPSKQDEYLSDGMTEEIITALSKVPGLHVAARTSSFAFKGKNEDIEKIGRQLRVGNVLEGSVSRVGDKLRITAQLINVADGYHLWSEDYDRQMRDIFAIRSDVAQRVAEALKIQLGVGTRQRITMHPTENLEAYQLYLKGRFYAGTLTKDGLQKGLDYFQQAIAIDPKFALAYVGISYYYQVIVDWYAPPREVMPKAIEAAAKALALDDTLAEAHIEMASARFWYDWDWAAAEQEFRRAIALNPNYATGHAYYGWYLIAMGRADQAIAENERALKLDPLSPEVNALLGQTLVWAGRYDAAIQHLRSWIDLGPDDWWSHLILGRAYQQTHNLPAALPEFERATQLEAANPETFATLVRGYAAAGRRDDARKGLAELLARSQRERVPAYDLATVYAALGDKDRALEWLDRAYTDRSFYLTGLKVDPDVDSLRAEPRFAVLLKKVGLEH
jgi:adenylate cyclase